MICINHTASSSSSRVSGDSLSIAKSSWSSLTSPGRRKPRENPGGTVLIPLLTVLLFEVPDRSSSPPGQKGTCPDFPRTKLFVGPGARSREVEVNPVRRREDGIYLNAIPLDTNFLIQSLSSYFSITRYTSTEASANKCQSSWCRRWL